MKTSLLLVLSAVGILFVSGAAQADQGTTPDLSGWHEFLKRSVLYVGYPDRIPARPVAARGGRIKRSNSKKTASESNRVFYHAISVEGTDQLTSLRQGMEAFTQTDDFASMTDNQELAFWLNFHNLAVIEYVAQNYPMRNAQQMVDPHLDEKVLSVFGEPWSIRQIEKYVIEKWQNPSVIYGFHRGYIGSPNIRRKGYTGLNVWASIGKNAKDFVNSLRGVQFWGSQAKVSVFYRDFEELFPGFGDNFRAHLLQYAQGNVAEKLKAAKSLKPKIKDGTVSDLYAGVTGGSSSVNDNPAALVFSQRPQNQANGSQIQNFFAVVATRSSLGAPMPDHARKFLETVFHRRLKESPNGVVTLEEFVTTEIVPVGEQEDQD